GIIKIGAQQFPVAVPGFYHDRIFITPFFLQVQQRALRLSLCLCLVDKLEVLHKCLLVPAGHVLQAVADLVDDTQLDVGFWIDGTYGLAEPRQVVNAGYEDVFQPPVLQMGQHLQPVVGPLAFGDVHPQYLLDPVFVHPQDIVQGLVPDPALLPYLEVHRVQPYNAIDRLQRTFLPFLYPGDDSVGDVAQHLRGYIGVIHFLDMGRDVTQAVAHAVHGDDLLFEVVGQDTLALLYYLRLEVAVAVLGRFYGHLPVTGLDGLLPHAVALVTRFPAFLLIGQVPVHLRLEGFFKETLKNGGKRPIFPEQRLTRQKLL